MKIRISRRVRIREETGKNFKGKNKADDKAESSKRGGYGNNQGKKKGP